MIVLKVVRKIALIHSHYVELCLQLKLVYIESFDYPESL